MTVQKEEPGAPGARLYFSYHHHQHPDAPAFGLTCWMLVVMIGEIEPGAWHQATFWTVGTVRIASVRTGSHSDPRDSYFLKRTVTPALADKLAFCSHAAQNSLPAVRPQCRAPAVLSGSASTDSIPGCAAAMRPVDHQLQELAESGGLNAAASSRRSVPRLRQVNLRVRYRRLC